MTTRVKSSSSAIVFLVDFAWVEYAKQLISSAHFNGGWNGDYVMLAVNVPESELSWFRDRGVYIFQCPDLAEYIKVSRERLNTSLNRIWMFSETFKRWEYLVYFDLDIIIKGDLSYLLNHTKILAARDSNRNSLEWQLKGDNSVMNSKILNQYRELDKVYDLKEDSFNAGVLSVHISRVGKYVFQELCEMYRMYAEIFSSRLHDQPLLNFYFYRNWIKMPAQFNVYANFSRINYFTPVDKIDAYVLHFAGVKLDHKPWHLENPYYAEWKQNYDKAEEFDISKPKNAAKFRSFEQLESDSEQLEKGWQRLRDYMKSYYSKLWLVRNPSHWIPACRVFIGNIISREI